jgi:hypothetical protein
MKPFLYANHAEHHGPVVRKPRPETMTGHHEGELAPNRDKDDDNGAVVVLTIVAFNVVTIAAGQCGGFHHPKVNISNFCSPFSADVSSVVCLFCCKDKRSR